VRAPIDIAALIARLNGRRVVMSLSTGKDSVAADLFLTECGIEHDRIFLDTSWENAAVARHLEYLREKLGPITALSGPLGMVDLIRKKGMFPSRARRFCTEELKTFPARDYLNALMESGDDMVNAVGIRRDESEARSKMPEWEWMDGFDCEVWRPLVTWTLEDVIAIHKRHDIKPNPLYLLGMERVGCWPCINSNKGELRKIAEIDPARIDEIRALEVEIGAKARVRHDARVAKYEAGGIEALNKRERGFMFDEDGSLKPFHPPHFFQSPLKEEGGKTWPIDRVVEWSRTKFGGRVADRQADLLSFGGINDGCMRWGMCETAPAPSARPSALTDEQRAARSPKLNNPPTDAMYRDAAAGKMDSLPYACSECGYEQADWDPCGACGSLRTVPITVLAKEFGENWRAECFPDEPAQ
jgi:3'-phosphoadenosine 5'-phosphosulfate sulfotransferase (PAPS reductase)/FAD synthetase